MKLVLVVTVAIAPAAVSADLNLNLHHAISEACMTYWLLITYNPQMRKFQRIIAH